MSDELACREVVELLSDYLDGGLDPGTRAHLEAHLAGCDGCTMILDQLRETVRRSGELTDDAMSPAQRDTLRAAFQRHHAGDV